MDVKKMTRVLIVEDDPMARKLLEIFITESENYQLVHSIDNAAMAEFYCAANQIEMILMDVCTAMGASGLDAAERIKKEFPYIKVIIMTSYPEYSFIEKARDCGVESFWYKTSVAEEILSIMDRTLAGENVYPDTAPSVRIGDAQSEEFTETELLVLREVVSGKSDAVIAANLHMSLRTVKTHIQNMRGKTGLRNRTELAVRARASGLVIKM